MNKAPLLLTSSIIAQDTTGKLNDRELRLFHTIQSIEHWAKLKDNINIVICDGSNFDFSNILHEKFPHLNIECIFFQNDADKVSELGKGYGEGEIIKYALDNSKYIQQANFFIKCTARLWVKNFIECLNQWNNNFIGKAHFENVFSLKSTKYGYFDTRFYMANLDIYKNIFLNIHKIPNMGARVHIEDSFSQAIFENNMKSFIFSTPPIICGISGASGKFYRASLHRQIKDKLKNFMVRNNADFTEYFSINNE